jgi:hypothetical protein
MFLHCCVRLDRSGEVYTPATGAVLAAQRYTGRTDPALPIMPIRDRGQMLPTARASGAQTQDRLRPQTAAGGRWIRRQ